MVVGQIYSQIDAVIYRLTRRIWYAPRRALAWLRRPRVPKDTVFLRSTVLEIIATTLRIHRDEYEAGITADQISATITDRELLLNWRKENLINLICARMKQHRRALTWPDQTR